MVWFVGPVPALFWMPQRGFVHTKSPFLGVKLLLSLPNVLAPTICHKCGTLTPLWRFSNQLWSFLGVEAVQGHFLSFPLLSPCPIKKPPQHFHPCSGRPLNLLVNADRLSIYHLQWRLCSSSGPLYFPLRSKGGTFCNISDMKHRAAMDSSSSSYYYYIFPPLIWAWPPLVAFCPSCPLKITIGVHAVCFDLHIWKGTEKWATENVQLVLQHCCRTSWIAMLHVLPPTSNLSCNKSGC